MELAILSDIHDHIWNLEKALKQIRERGIEAIIFCGDMCAPFTAGILGTSQIPIYACLGNNDEDQIALSKKGGDKFTWTSLADEHGVINIDGREIAFCHYPKLGELLAKSEKNDAVFYGHTHNSQNTTYGKTLLVNPGAVCGIQKGASGIASFAIYSSQTNTAEIIEID